MRCFAGSRRRVTGRTPAFVMSTARPWRSSSCRYPTISYQSFNAELEGLFGVVALHSIEIGSPARSGRLEPGRGSGGRTCFGVLGRLLGHDLPVGSGLHGNIT